MKVTVTRSEKEFDIAAGLKIVSQIMKKRDSVIGLSTGNTTGGMHGVVAEIYKNYSFDTSQVTLFGVDEIAKVPEGFKKTCSAELLEEIVGPIGMPLSNFIMPRPQCDDYDAECKNFIDELNARGGIDLQMLGIGIDGHLGMNLPGTDFDSSTRLTPLSGELEDRIRRKNNYPAPAPLAGITLGIKDIMNIRHIILVAKGESKAQIIEKAVNGKVTPDVPASILQLHPNCEVLLDSKAAEYLYPEN